VVPAGLHDFFVASGSVAGALIGLLFVALSVSAERHAQGRAGALLHPIRAAAALTAFTNALTVSLFALIPGQKIGPAALAVAIGGLLFVLASLLALARQRQLRWATVRDAVFLLGLLITFVVQLVQGADVIATPGDPGAVNTIAILVVVCFLIGIARAWELIGGPSIGMGQQVAALIRGQDRETGDPVAEEPGPEPPGPPHPGGGPPR
jgi:uncharacterized membrane protein